MPNLFKHFGFEACKTFVQTLARAKKDFCSKNLGTKNLDAKQDFCSKNLDAKDDFCLNILGAKQD